MLVSESGWAEKTTSLGVESVRREGREGGREGGRERERERETEGGREGGGGGSHEAGVN